MHCNPQIELRNGQAIVQAGAGIVPNSVPEHEYAETVNKARGCSAIELRNGALARYRCNRVNL